MNQSSKIGTATISFKGVGPKEFLLFICTYVYKERTIQFDFKRQRMLQVCGQYHWCGQQTACSDWGLCCPLHLLVVVHTATHSYTRVMYNTNIKWNSVCWERKEKSEKPATVGLEPRVSDYRRHKPLSHEATTKTTLHNSPSILHWWYCQLPSHTGETTQLCGSTRGDVSLLTLLAIFTTSVMYVV